MEEKCNVFSVEAALRVLNTCSSNVVIAKGYSKLSQRKILLLIFLLLGLLLLGWV
jgi:hypothetical protein